MNTQANEQTAVNTATKKVKESKNLPAALVVSCPVIFADGEAKPEDKQTFELDLSRPNVSIGQYCRDSEKALTVSIFGAKVTIPSGKAKGGQQRFYEAVQAITAAIYSGSEPNDSPKDEKKITFVNGLKNCGLYFTDNSRLQVETAVKTKVDYIRSHVALAKSVVRAIPENKVMIEQTKTARILNREVKANGIAAAAKMVEAMKRAGNGYGAKLLTV